MAPVLVVVGPPGAGKTTVGRLVSDALSVPFRDTDADVESSAGRSIADIFVEDGEPAFRALEQLAVSAALAKHGGVLAVGGGAVLDAATRDELARHRVVFLDVSISDAARRIGFNRDRPLLLGNPRAQWISLMGARRGFYEQVADVTVSTDGRTAADVAAEVVRAIEGTR